MTAKKITRVPVKVFYRRVEQAFKFNVEGSLALSPYFVTRFICSYFQHPPAAYAA